ncbi:MAG: hypothetical protein AAF840_17205, partial [Bacteroidota bacterium]
MTLTITDEIFPDLTCKDAATIELGPDGTYQVQFSDLAISASDNCGQGFFFSPSNLDCDDLGNGPVSVAVVSRDPSNNRTICNVDVTILEPECPCIGSDGALVINNPEDVALCSDLTVSSLRFIEGGLDLFGYDLTIDVTGGRIFDESENNFVSDEQGGNVIGLGLSNSSRELLTDIGLEVFAAGAFQFVEVQRSPVSVIVGDSTSIRRVLTLEEDVSPVFPNARFHYLDVELEGREESGFGLFLEQNGEWEPVPVLVHNTTDNYLEFALDFSQLPSTVRLTMAPIEALLPLDLLQFTGSTLDKTNALSWTTANEEAFSHFEVERSADGSSWQFLGEVAGAGLTTTTAGYDFVDATPLVAAFYRLRMVDLDGSFAYSPLVFLERQEQRELRVFPNPAANFLQVQLPTALNEEVFVRLLDLSGKVMSEVQA